MNKDKITHKEHRQLLSGLYKKQGGKWIYQADTYIKQQEKQEKLLKLYKELIVVKDELISIAWFDGSCDEMEELETNLEKQIKEIENGS